MQRVAIVYDDTLRPETTGTYCLRGLQDLVATGELESVKHLLPGQLSHLDTEQFDLCLFVDDGLDYDLSLLEIPTVWWAIDTHVSFERCLKKARQADATFVAQLNAVQMVQEAGIEQAKWLPLACDPEIHGRREFGNQYDLAFVGHIFPGERETLLALLQKHHPHSFFGQADYRRMAEIYSAAKLVFNRSLRDDINMRVFEGLCSGSLLITNDLAINGQNELFIPGEHLITYHSAEDLLEKVNYYLAHDGERKRIAASGQAHVLQKHTYRHRMAAVLEEMRGKGTEVRGQGSGKTTQRSTLASAPCPLTAAKPLGYFEFDRPDVLALVPSTVRRVLDIGCGGGKLGAAIKARQSAYVTGIELQSAAIDAAVQRLDEVIIGDVQNDAIDFPDHSFDCVICADVLEHLRDPLSVLRKIRRWLTPDGLLVTSLPNVRNHTVIRSLLAGNWTYETAGLLDEDHVRFFTRREIEKLLFRAGFDVQQQRMVPGEGYQDWVQQGSPLQIQLGPFQLHVSSQEEVAEFFAYQYLTTASPAPQTDQGLTSIVIVTHNQWRHTRACLESIHLRTDLPYEIILVDNASTDGTPEFVSQFPDVQLIRNETNRGFPAAANQGILVSRGEQVLLLNNDTIVTTGWLERLLGAFNNQPDIGLAGPVTNRISGEQQVSVSYDDLAQLDGFAWDWGKQHQRQSLPTDRLVGFCLLIKREVIDRIGLLDERFGIGNFEDDDYCRRAIAAGYQCVIARDAFIHHVGSTTFRASGINFDHLLRENRQKYEQKWEKTTEDTEKMELPSEPCTPVEIEGNSAQSRGDATPQREAPCVSAPLRLCAEFLHERREAGDDRPLSPPSVPSPQTPSPQTEIPRGSPIRPQYLLKASDDGELLLKHNDVKLSACLIVRDNEDTIRPCLESLKPWMDEIVIVDTGSLDRTPQICEELGARVLHSPWQDSFAQARNVSLSFARGEWIFWMDSDDTLPERCGRALRELVLGPHREQVLGYIVQVHCPGVTPDDVTVVDHVKLIRNRPDLRFEFHIHEQILPAIRRAHGEVAWTDLYVVHSGSDKTPAGRKRKLARDFKLLALDLAQHPDHPFVLFNLGMTHADAGQHQQAVQYLSRCVEVSTPQESHLRKAYALLIGSLMQLRHWDHARQSCTDSLQLFPGDKELLFRQAMLFHQQGQLREAEQTYLRILSEQTQRHFTSIDQGLSNHKARHNLAIVYEDLGQYDDAITQWQTILQHRPDYTPALQALKMRTPSVKGAVP
mgnify:CR=1 FL=1|jgi:Predicted glycosyltransferases